MSIRVLVVEDEPPIARSLARMIEAEKPDFKVTACVINGKAALEWLEREEADIVFTDIRMPSMDGIELMSRLNRQYPELPKVVVSGYQDFEYARKAIRHQALDYLLKPVERTELRKVLGKLEEMVRSRADEIRRNYLFELLSGEANLSEPPPAGLAGRRYVAAVVCAGPFPLVPAGSMIPAKGYWQRIGLEERASRLAERKDNVWILDGKSGADKVVLLGAEGEESASRLQGLCEELLAEGERTLTVTASPVLDGVREVASFYAAARLALYQQVELERAKLIRCESRRPVLAGEGGRPAAPDMTEVLLSELARKNWDGLDDGLRELFAEFARRRLPQIDLEQALNLLAVKIYESPFQASFPVAELQFDIREAITNASGYDDLRANLLSVFQNMFASRDAELVPPVVRDVERFLKEHYAEAITNETLSRTFGFVSSYISKLFRTHMRMSPSQYLTKLRIEKAKEMIAADPDLRVREVADLVGFNDALYFSRVFKKETGIWPTDYKGG
ncbi:response regulator [Cohnella cellulosilytica]|uniref:Response regulator n=1 Tax=Cohnella cellulosilytica TaxID=986710 RepID=A0ABW2FG28_9BACL